MENRANQSAARGAVIFSVATLAFLAILHFISPEFDPSWRMVSEYALGKNQWALTGMFLSWALSSWLLAYALRGEVRTRWGKTGIYLLVAAGIGEAAAAPLDIRHSLHGLTALVGGMSLPIAALLVSYSLKKQPNWMIFSPNLVRFAHFPWLSQVVFMMAMGLFISSYMAAGGKMEPNCEAVQTLPEGVTTVVGWTNRLLIAAYCAWVFVAASTALKIQQK